MTLWKGRCSGGRDPPGISGDESFPDELKCSGIRIRWSVRPDVSSFWFAWVAGSGNHSDQHQALQQLDYGFSVAEQVRISDWRAFQTWKLSKK